MGIRGGPTKLSGREDLQPLDKSFRQDPAYIFNAQVNHQCTQTKRRKDTESVCQIHGGASCHETTVLFFRPRKAKIASSVSKTVSVNLVSHQGF